MQFVYCRIGHIFWVTLGCLTLVWGAPGCESKAKKSTNTNDGDATVGECTPGEIICQGTIARHCNSDGEWEDEECDSACVMGEGCVACVEGRLYCIDNQVAVCNANHELEPQYECDETTVCIMGECVSKCDPQVLEPSNEGCEFWAVDLDNEATDMGFGGNDAAAQQYAVAVANVNDYPVQVTVYKNTAAFGASVTEVEVTTVNVQPNSLEQIDLPQREVDGCMGQNGDYQKYSGSGTFVSSHAYRIESNGPVVAYQFNPIIQQFSNDASILIPTQALGKYHYVMGWSTANPCGDPQMTDESVPDHTAITVVGVHENTHVTVYPTHKVKASGGDSGLQIPDTEPGEPIEFDIGPYDVVNLESWQPTGSIMECMNLMLDYPGDFTGSRVEATKPVAVFTSLERGIGFGGAEPDPHPDWDGELCCTDHLEQQLFPVEALGWKFIITRSPVRSTDPNWREPDIYRILATENGTTVTTSLDDFPEFTLDAGEYATFHATAGFTVESQGGAIMIAQVLVSQQYIPEGYIGDPTMVIFPPAEQHRLSYVFLVPSTFQDNYVTMAVPSNATIELDGQTPGEFDTMCESESVGMLETTHYFQWTCELTEGVHTVEASEPVGLAVYGYYNVGSYGYPGGSDVNIINPVE
jgi:hypothetical protein